MCLPVFAGIGVAMGATAGTTTAAALGTAMVASTIASPLLAIHGQQQAGKAQAIAQERSTEAEYKRVAQQQAGERIQEQFQTTERSQELMKATIAAKKARSRASVAAGETNVSGVSVDALLDDFTRQEAVFRFGLETQANQQGVARNLRMKDGTMASYNTALSINQPIKRPDYAGAVTGLVSGGLTLASLNG